MVDWKQVLKQRLAARSVDYTRHFTVIEELAQHLDDRYRSLLSQGILPADAEQSVRQELDEDEALERELRRAERTTRVDAPILGNQPRPGPIEGWLQDIRYAARALRKNPGFSAVAVIALALGVGANTAIFSVVNAVMLRPLPYPDAARLVRVWESNIERGWPTFSTSQPNFLDFRAQATTFEALAATGGRSLTLTSTQGAEVVPGAAVTVDFLPVLRQLPVLGRNFLASEDRPGGDVRVAILSDGFWKRHFGSDPAIIGRSIQLSSANYVVVGVLPPQFEWGTAELLVPLAPDPKESRGDHQLTAIGRLKSGVTIEQAHTDLARIASALGEQYPESNKGWSVRLASFYDWLIPEPTRESLVILLGAVGGLLPIACANVASLLLARGAARQKELAIRVALGARRWRIIRQLLTESLLLALLACLAGVGVAAAATRVLVAYGPQSVPRLDEASLDVNVILFALGISLVTVFVFGLIPAIQVSRQRPAAALQDSARGSSGDTSRQRLRSALTVVEVALSVTLLIGAGLLLRSFWHLQQVDPGFELSPLMTARITLPVATYANRDVRKVFYDRLLSETQALPGVVAAATASGMPLAGGNTSTELRVPGAAAHGATPSASWLLVSPGFFATMGIPLRGRDFSDDPEEALRTTIISEAMAREFWPNEDSIGRTFIPSSLGNRERTIIGVAGDVRNFGLDTGPPRMVYYSTTQFSLNSTYLVWRSTGDPASHVASVRDIIRRIDPSVALYQTRSFTELLSQSFGPRRFNMYLLSVFAGVALLLAAIGLFGVMAYLVSQRTREIGVRLALGADRRDIFRLILGRGVVLAASGALIGVGAAFWLTRVMQSLLFSVSATDPGTFVAVPILLVIVALIACYVPARRAVRVDPVTALRAE
jgi:putative ABC transport system permease protein